MYRTAETRWANPVNPDPRSVFTLNGWVRRQEIGKTGPQSAVWHGAAASTNNRDDPSSHRGFRITAQQIIKLMTVDGDQAGELFLQQEDNLKCHHQQHLFKKEWIKYETKRRKSSHQHYLTLSGFAHKLLDVNLSTQVTNGNWYIFYEHTRCQVGF